MVAFGLGPGMVADDVVVQRALPYRRPVEVAPTLAGRVEAELHLAEHVVHPLIMEPSRLGKLGADFRNHRGRPVASVLTPVRIAQFLLDGVRDR